MKILCHCLTSTKISQSILSEIPFMTASFISSTMDSNSDFGFGGSGDEDASFTQAHEEEEEQQDENIVPATVSPTN